MKHRLFLLPLSLRAALGSTSVLPAETGAAHSAAKPIVIAHRGASGYRPEHTLAAYELAIDMGANFIEPDLVMTKDGVLVARHENALALIDPATGAVTEATSNVHDLAQFAARRTSKIVDGKTLMGWFTEDFTLSELKTLRARERIPKARPGNRAHDDKYPIPTLQEVIDLARAKSAALGRTIGIYPETKHPSYHASIGLPMEDALVRILAANGLDHAAAPVYIQSFETANLRYLRTITKVKLVQLLLAHGRPWDFKAHGDPRTYADLASAKGLQEIATYAHGVGPDKRHIIPRNTDGTLGTPTSFVRDAHAAQLVVHPWTFRTENAFLPSEHMRGSNRTDHGDGEGEILAFLRAGIDGFFTDQADVGVAAVKKFIAGSE
jgi:glycerophosphoryl diester phosphodiesterase